MGEAMFCFQCEQTAGGKGCTKVGVCGKDPTVAALQDLLIYELKGIGFWGQRLIEKRMEMPSAAIEFVMDAIFSTLTNVNFDADRFVQYLKTADQIKRSLKDQVGGLADPIPEQATYELPQTVDQMLVDAVKAGIMADPNLDPDLRSLQWTIIYGLKGLGAYAHHAWVLGYTDNDVSNFFFKALDALTDKKKNADDLLNLVLELGSVNFRCMEVLDKANTESYGHPEPTQVLVTKKKGPLIIVSGHDLKDLKQLLEQTEGKGINIYTHGEMLPSHAYPELKKYPHLVGNYGSAWFNQTKEFDGLPGCILMTTNCIQKPRDSYQDRIFATSIVGFPEVQYIAENDGVKDFTPIIDRALELGGWSEDEEERSILVGFGRNATLSNADKIVNAVKQGQIKHFFLIGGCDGAKQSRVYYSQFAELVPKDSVILTLACGKYRFNHKDFGAINGIPRFLDIGQCNDSFSAIKIAVALADAFNCSVNDLPLSLVLSWYEQKAVAVLLTLLSLGIKNIYLGPSLPAFISPNILQVLVDKFNITPISDPETDIKKIFG